MKVQRSDAVWATLLGGALATASLGQVYSNGFDAVGGEGLAGPSALIAAGWSFPHVLDTGLSHNWWKQAPWHGGHPAAWQGSGYLSASLSVPAFGARSYAQWIVLPPLTGQRAGQILSAHVRGFTSEFPIAGSVQLRYSPTGGTSTGGTTTSLGDFTVLLDSNSNGSLTAWDELQGVVPGEGRIALRWWGTVDGGFSGTVMDFLLDDLSLDDDPNAPRMPQPGETLHWTTAMSPIRLVNQQVVPRGATLIIDAGVQITFDFNTPQFTGPELLAAGGTIRFEGTPAAPVVLRRGVNATQTPRIGVGSNLLETVGTAGTIHATHVDSDIGFIAGQSSLMTIRESIVSREAPIDWGSDVDALYQVPRVEGRFATIVMENCVLRHAIAEFDDTMFMMTGCDFDNGRLNVHRFPIAQPAVIEGNIFRNTLAAAPLELDGYDFHVAASNTFVNNFSPISLRGAGLTADSVVPATGNTHNRVFFTGSVNAMDIVGPITLPPMAIPYRLWAGMTEGEQFDPRVRCLAGTVIEMDPATYLSFRGPSRFEILGTPEAPVRLVPSVPGQRWMTFQTASNPPLIIRNAIFDGGDLATGGVDTLFTLHDCTITNSGEGVRSGDWCGVTLSKTRFVNNDIGARAIWGSTQGTFAQGVLGVYGAANHNAFEGNGAGVVVDPPHANPSTIPDTWWDSASGPTSPSNPLGNGQSASLGVNVSPFLTAPVDFADHPPVVRAVQPARARRLRIGSKILLHWDARDDRVITSQRLEHLPVYGFRDPVTVVSGIPADARSVELTITADGQTTQVYRIVSVDDLGQEGFDDFHLSIGEDHALEFQWLTDLSGGYRVGENFPVDVTGDSTMPFELHIDDLLHDIQPLGDDGGGLSAGRNTMPAVSTDLARYAMIWLGEPHYSPYFTIRPQQGFGDEPPRVSLNSPLPGSAFGAGTVVPLRWTADDDHGVRSFDLHASYDGGESWHLFASELSSTTRAYDWPLPASTGIADVRVRVVARDSRFQVSSHTIASIEITPGSWPVGCVADFNQDGGIDGQDLEAFFRAWEAAEVRADVNLDGGVDGSDIEAFFLAWESGSC